MTRRWFAPLAALSLLLGGWPAHAQGPDGRGEERTDSAVYNGITANAPVPAEFHIRNEGGADGAGLCVVSSLIINGAYQGVGDLASLKDSELWREAKAAPGGYYPGKLEDLLRRVMPDAKWFSWEGDGTDLLEQYSAAGYPIASTMSTGALYQYVPIHHMISLIHIDAEWACVVDNNDPGFYHWMPAAEYSRRFKDGPKGWGVVWLKPPRRSLLVTWEIAPALVLVVSGFVILAASASRQRSSEVLVS